MTKFSERITTRQATLSYRADIDGLRSIAVLLVVLFHFQIFEFLEAGFMGVDIFFVISGYLIVTIISQQLSTNTFRFGQFYANRVRRLAPALVVTVILTSFVGVIILTPQELVGLAKEGVAAQLYASNIYYWRYLNYFGLQADGALFLHTWSLAVEEQFYLACPIALYVIARFKPHLQTAFFSVILVGSFSLNLVSIGWKPEATFYLLPTRAWEFASGALVPQMGVIIARYRVRPQYLALAGFALLAAALVFYRNDIAFPGAFALLPVSATVALLLAGESEGSGYVRLMSNPAFVYLGKISYEIYLVHWPIRVFAPLLFIDYGFGVRIGCLALTLVVAASVYHAIEMPVRTRRWFGSNRSVVIGYGCSTLAALGFLAWVISTDGLPVRLDRSALAMAAHYSDVDNDYLNCEGRAVSPCRIGAAERNPTWIVYGDSHANALAAPFNAFFKSHDTAGYFAFQSGCIPLDQSGHIRCRSFQNDLNAFLASHTEIRNVVIVSTWRQPLERSYTDQNGISVRGKAAIDAFDFAFDKTIVKLHANGRRVIIWQPVPGARRSIPQSLARNSMLGRQWNLTFTQAEHDRTFEFLSAALKRHPRIISIDPSATICSSGKCQIMNEGWPLYNDDAHPAFSQTKFYQKIIAKALGGETLPRNE